MTEKEEKKKVGEQTTVWKDQLEFKSTINKVFTEKAGKLSESRRSKNIYL